ncbi:chitin synthase-domain-containing protein [Naematelia encephala]|uniref:chitin synthase n=1 Tax=Naematelia encephala TaxID=71784 RepID=A0A1Y2AIM1_9TREE|nr:chitin synthase-domain-containing protein [Naematelia encephala]
MSFSSPNTAGPSQSRMSSRFESISDLCALPTVAEDTILAALRERFLASQPYISLSSSALVSINPHTYLPINGDSSLQNYVAEYYRSSADDDVSRTAGDGHGKEGASPHVFRMALSAYYNMKRTRQDQIMLMSGAMGSGKSEMRRLAIKAISEVSVAPAGKKGYKVGGQVANAQFILEAFGNAHTLSNDNASRFGNYTELQFNDRGRLDGLKTIEYYFERSRVSQTPANGERNFHIFYYLVSGVTGDEKSHLKLGHTNDYRYLQCRVRRHGVDDKQRFEGFEQLKQAFKSVGMSTRLVAQVCQLLATILHIGNLNFSDGGEKHEGAIVTNFDVLTTVAEFLGVSQEALGELFSFKTILMRKEVCTTFLDTEQAEQVRDELARTLYSLLFSWLNEHINQKLCKDSFGSFIAILDLPGSQNNAGPMHGINSVDQFCFNFANEKLHNWTLRRIHEVPLEEASKETLPLSRLPYFDNSECLKMLSDPRAGLIRIADDQASKKRSESSLLEAIAKRYHGHGSLSTSTNASSFTVNHYNGSVTYSAENFLERNANETSSDVLRLLRGSGLGAQPNSEYQGSNNPFIKGLFTSKSITTQAHPRNDDTIVAVQQPVRPMRAPSTRRKKGKKLAAVTEEAGDEVEDDEVGGGNDASAGKELQCVAGQHWSALLTLLSTFDQAQPWFIFCLRPNDSQLPSQVETRSVKAQIRSLGLTEMALRMKTNYEVRMTHAEACERYAEEFAVRGILEGPAYVDRLQDLKRVLKLGDEQMAIGTNRVFLSHSVFHRFEDRLRAEDEEHHQHPQSDRMEMLDEKEKMDPFSPYIREGSPGNSPALGYNDPYDHNGSTAALPLVDHAQLLRQDSPDEFDVPRGFAPSQMAGSQFADSASNVGTETYAPSRNMFRDFDAKDEKDPLDAEPQDGEIQEEYKESLGRRRWVWLCRILTFWIPGFLLSKVGGMKRQDIRQAWREKLTINLIIWFICGCTIFVIAILGNLICPTQHVYSSSELASHNFKDNPNNAFVAIRGEVFDLTTFAPTHLTAVSVVPTKSIMQYGGLDASNLFPVQVSALCEGTTGSISPYVTLDSTNRSDPNTKYHDFRAFTNDSRPDWYAEMMIQMRYRFRTGFMGYTKKDIKSMASSGRAVAIYDGLIYELTTYIQQNGGGLQGPSGYNFTAQDQADRQFMSGDVVSLFTYNSGKDITDLVNGLSSTIGSDVVARQTTCLRNLFIIGKVDTRDSAQCKFSEYILLALSCVMVAIIGFKFLAALHFGSSRAPENHDKFVICQVPCYTESEDSLRRTIDSLVRLKYDDKRKLLLIICDGNIKGFGNDKATPAIVLDILGVDPHADPEPLSFQSLGEGAKQHNMGKIYAGLYECAGHVVPYLVVVKVGKPTERPKPGNRGKRDSQMVIMHFLNKVHFNAPMNPLELEMYHQIKNVIGVNPSFYEYLLQVDADTTVDEMSLNRLVSAMMHDKKIIGVCGETSIANAKQSIVTMAQVYEYFISHHLAKAFESLFGSITCLPGCFSMYRLRTPDTHKPLFVSNQIIHDYSENRVDTLHLKNLLHLGEDRYLTTLVLKHFPTYKTKFVRDAHAETVAPDQAGVLLSQRRRWINSTIHNLAELVFLDQLCGFCCFSMRFVVFIDLLSTVIAPVTVAYIGYLIYLVVHDGSTIPTLSIVMLAAIYGLQALIFVFRMRWDMIAWMIFYILAIPVFSFFLPLYSFWKMDDFSWGSTRLVVGERGKKIVIHDEGKFDPRSIPMKSWNDYENELWDHESNKSLGSWMPPKPEYDSRAPSSYGGYDMEDGQMRQRGLSPAISYQDLGGRSRPQSAYEMPPRLPYGNTNLMGSPLGTHALLPADNRSMYGDNRSLYGENRSMYAGSVYNQPAVDYRGSNYSLSGMPPPHPGLEQRQSSYSFVQAPMPHGNESRQSSYAFPQAPFGDSSNHDYNQAQQRQSSYSVAPAQQRQSSYSTAPAPSRPASNFLPELASATDPLSLGQVGITDAQLEASIRRICAGADLDHLTKKGVRKQLEEEYGTDLGARKDSINRIIEKVLAGAFLTDLNTNEEHG